MAITIVTTSFPIKGDGSEAAGSFVKDLVEEISRQNYSIRVVAPGNIETIEQWNNNIQIYRYAAPAKAISTLKPWNPKDLFWFIKIINGGLRATQLATSNDTRHILALWALPCGEWARRIAHKNNIDYSVWMLGSDVWVLGKIPLIKTLLAKVIQQAKNAYADGYQLAIDAQYISSKTIEFLPSTRNIGALSYPALRSAPPYRFLFLGRWHTNKGIDILLDALNELKDQDWKLIEIIEIQGGGPLQNLVKSKVKALQMSNRPVIFGSYLNKLEAESAISRSDWLFIPSRIESIPVVFSDAMKIGRPVISMPTGDLPKLLTDTLCGILAERIDAHSFALAIQKALSTSTTIFLDGIQQQAKVFNIQNLAQDLIQKMQSYE